jgi:hypothetical protein
MSSDITQARFAEMDAANPHIWELFVRFTFEKISAGFLHYGATAVLNRVRWETAARASGSGFKLNNNWNAFYVRKFNRVYPQHATFFRTRFSLADDW